MKVFRGQLTQNRNINSQQSAQWFRMSKDKSNKLNKKKILTPERRRLLSKGYEEGAEEDLSIAKDFEAAENELDKNCDK